MPKTRISKGVISLSLAAAIAIPLAACDASASASTASSSSSATTAKAAPTPIAQLASLKGKPGQSTAVKLDPGFLAALKSLGLTPGVTGTAQLTDGSLIFPITAGNVTYYKPRSIFPYVQGDLQHDGSGITLTAGGTVVGLSNFDIDPGTSKLYGDVSVNGAPAADHAFLFDLDGSTLQPLKTEGDKAILQGTTVKMSADAAALLDATFKTEAVKKGLVIGIATITVSTAK
ncbi:MAG: hypothetical protein ABI137_10815 [Antricoccus sp.]